MQGWGLPRQPPARVSTSEVGKQPPDSLTPYSHPPLTGGGPALKVKADTKADSPDSGGEVVSAPKLKPKSLP